MAISDNENYTLKGKQVKDLAGRVKENASDISSLEAAVAGKQDALTATQLNAVNSGIDSTNVAQIATNATDIDGIEAKIPAQATASNQLADKAFVNSSVATNTANFVGTFNTIEELEAVQNPTNNDYGFVIGTDATGNTVYNRYKYNGTSWVFEYALNNSSFTAEQWAAIQSGITAGLVTKLNGVEAGAEVNDINSISVNGTAVTPDANKNVDLTIGGGIKTLTTADYNWNNSTKTTVDPNCIGVWLLEPGVYMIAEQSVRVCIDGSGSSVSVGEEFGEMFRISVGASGVSGAGTHSKCYAKLNDIAYVPQNISGSTQYLKTWTFLTFYDDNGEKLTTRTVLFSDSMNDLSSRSLTGPLSAVKGKELMDSIGDLTTLTTTAKTSAVAAINELDSDKADKTAFTGTDGTAAGTQGLVPAPVITDVDKFLKSDGTWEEVDGGGKTLTADDYNYHSSGDTDNQIALWELGNGLYKIGSDIAGQSVILPWLGNVVALTEDTVVIVGKNATDTAVSVTLYYNGNLMNFAVNGSGQALTPTATSAFSVLTGAHSINHLGYSAEPYSPLAANQGRVLNEKIEGMITMTDTDPGEGAPLAANHFIAYYE